MGVVESRISATMYYECLPSPLMCWEQKEKLYEFSMKKKELSVNWEGPAVEGKTIVVGVVKLLSVVSVYVCVVFVRVCV